LRAGASAPVPGPPVTALGVPLVPGVPADVRVLAPVSEVTSLPWEAPPVITGINEGPTCGVEPGGIPRYHESRFITFMTHSMKLGAGTTAVECI
jgi:hypothetical protein